MVMPDRQEEDEDAVLDVAEPYETQSLPASRTQFVNALDDLPPIPKKNASVRKQKST